MKESDAPKLDGDDMLGQSITRRLSLNRRLSRKETKLGGSIHRPSLIGSLIEGHNDVSQNHGLERSFAGFDIGR